MVGLVTRLPGNPGDGCRFANLLGGGVRQPWTFPLLPTRDSILFACGCSLHDAGTSETGRDRFCRWALLGGLAGIGLGGGVGRSSTVSLSVLSNTFSKLLERNPYFNLLGFGGRDGLPGDLVCCHSNGSVGVTETLPLGGSLRPEVSLRVTVRGRGTDDKELTGCSDVEDVFFFWGTGGGGAVRRGDVTRCCLVIAGGWDFFTGSTDVTTPCSGWGDSLDTLVFGLSPMATFCITCCCLVTAGGWDFLTGSTDVASPCSGWGDSLDTLVFGLSPMATFCITIFFNLEGFLGILGFDVEISSSHCSLCSRFVSGREAVGVVSVEIGPPDLPASSMKVALPDRRWCLFGFFGGWDDDVSSCLPSSLTGESSNAGITCLDGETLSLPEAPP